MRPSLTLDRFYKRIEVTPSGCWIWQGAVGGRGYGQIRVNKKIILAHRWAYEKLVGPIPAGLDLDHLCRVCACVRPEHLEPVTRSENLKRGIGVGGARYKGRKVNHV